MVGGAAAVSLRLAAAGLALLTWGISDKAAKDKARLQNADYAQSQLLLGLERAGVIKPLESGNAKIEFVTD